MVPVQQTGEKEYIRLAIGLLHIMHGVDYFKDRKQVASIHKASRYLGLPFCPYIVGRVKIILRGGIQ